MSNQYEVLGKAPVAEDLKKLSFCELIILIMSTQIIIIFFSYINF